MDYSTFIDEIVEKYGYQDNVRRAIEIAIPLMVKKYGAQKERNGLLKESLYYQM